MKNRISVAVFCLMFVGCRNGYNRLIDRSVESPPSGPVLITVSCCKDNNLGVTSYPSFLPESHVKVCEEAYASNRADTLIDGNVHLAMSVDCGNGHHKIGDDYYKGRGY